MKYLTGNKHWEINKEYNIIKLLYLLIDRPNEITIVDLLWGNGKKNKWHRDYDLPAVVEGNYYFAWYYNNIRHRNGNKPARICSDGYKEYYINGKLVATRGKYKCL